MESNLKVQVYFPRGPTRDCTLAPAITKDAAAWGGTRRTPWATIRIVFNPPWRWRLPLNRVDHRSFAWFPFNPNARSLSRSVCELIMDPMSNELASRSAAQTNDAAMCKFGVMLSNRNLFLADQITQITVTKAATRQIWWKLRKYPRERQLTRNSVSERVGVDETNLSKAVGKPRIATKQSNLRSKHPLSSTLAPWNE